MTVKLIAYGIARDILNRSSLDYQLTEDGSVADLKEKLMIEYPEFEKLRSLKFAVKEDYQEDAFVLRQGDEVVIIPPVSGG